MPICVVGQTVNVSIEVQILKAFAFEDRIYYIAKPLRGHGDAIWLLNTDGSVVDFNEELLQRAYRILGTL